MIEYMVKVNENGDRYWYKDDKLHREDGPAVEYSYGEYFWYKKGKPHREDGPAVIWADGTLKWYKDGVLHRENGPAIEHANGKRYWYIDGKRLTEEEFNARTNSCNGKIVTIDGKKYRLEEV